MQDIGKCQRSLEMANKLELTWVGNDKEIKIEPRLLIENVALSNVAIVIAEKAGNNC